MGRQPNTPPVPPANGGDGANQPPVVPSPPAVDASKKNQPPPVPPANGGDGANQPPVVPSPPAVDEVKVNEPTHVRVKQTRTLKLSGADPVQIPDTSTVPVQVYALKDFEKMKKSLAEEGITLEEIERF
jgi:hypothetical protein